MGKGKKVSNNPVLDRSVPENQWPSDTTKSPTGHVLALRPFKGTKNKSLLAPQQAPSSDSTAAATEPPSYENSAELTAPEEPALEDAAPLSNNNIISPAFSVDPEPMLVDLTTATFDNVFEIVPHATDGDLFDFDLGSSDHSTNLDSLFDFNAYSAPSPESFTTTTTFGSGEIHQDAIFASDDFGQQRIRELEDNFAALTLRFQVQAQYVGHLEGRNEELEGRVDELEGELDYQESFRGYDSWYGKEAKN